MCVHVNSKMLITYLRYMNVLKFVNSAVVALGMPGSNLLYYICTGGPGTRSRKRGKAIHEQHSSEDPSSVLEPSLRTAMVSVQVSSIVASNSQQRRQAKRISRGTAALGSRDKIRRDRRD